MLAGACILKHVDVIISDLDGTLLDHASYSFEPARPGLELLKSRQIPLVYCSSKTRKEVEHWRRLTGNEHPYIVENGGAAVIPAGYFPSAIPGARTLPEFVVVPLGDDYADLSACLDEASAAAQCKVRAFHEMTADEVAQACGLSVDSAALAKAREYDEPFLIIDENRTAELLAAIARKGKRWTRGGRFYHIIGSNDKAAATIVLLDAYRASGSIVRSVGIGDGMNDAPFLNIVDVPVLIRTPWLEELQAAVPRGNATTLGGPHGWNEAIMALFA
jgi:mannosyl-3-phosphoglycerate phosphatase family protein